MNNVGNKNSLSPKWSSGSFCIYITTMCVWIHAHRQHQFTGFYFEGILNFKELFFPFWYLLCQFHHFLSISLWRFWFGTDVCLPWAFFVFFTHRYFEQCHFRPLLCIHVQSECENILPKPFRSFPFPFQRSWLSENTAIWPHSLQRVPGLHLGNPL